MNQTNDKQNESNFEDSCMSFGDHLTELRSCLIKSIIGLVVGFIICLFLGGKILEIITTPVLAALQAAGHEPQLHTLTLPEKFMTYMKISLFSGIFLASPWIFYQLWKFISVGLYPRERRYVHIFMPFSASLFILGGIFFLLVVAPISFHFFINFGSNWQKTEFLDNFLTKKLLISTEKSSSAPPNAALAKNETSTSDQPTPPPSRTQTELQPQVDPQAQPDKPAPLIKHTFTLQKYISLVVVLALAFGLAFQMPLVVFFLGRTGIVPISTFRSVRKFVLFGIIIFSAMITPPDVISQLAMSTPMYVLYEIGILLLRFWPRST